MVDGYRPMKIAMFSINPLFPDRTNGGSPKHLQRVALHLGGLGHRVTILSTRHPDSAGDFHWHPNVEVRPLLRFKQPFPQPYAIPYHDYACNLQAVGDLLQGSDRLYIHDSELLFPPVFDQIPTVVSVRDNSYPETMIGAFLFRGDRMICVSEYSRQLWLHTAGRFYPDAAERVITINNGVDWGEFRPTPPSQELLDLLRITPDDGPILLHPHRPERFKGFDETLEVARRLVREHGISDLRVLVPRYFDAAHCDGVDGFYRAFEQRIAEQGLQHHFVLHPWIPHRLMAEYYSLGTLTLVLGSCVEPFANTVYESLGCGTPAIVARIGSHRELVPEGLLDKVRYGDHAAAAGIAARLIRERPGVSAATQAYLRAQFGVERQLDGYAEAILGACKRPPLAYRHPPIDQKTRYRLAPWCDRSEGGFFYHDIRAMGTRMPALDRLLDRGRDFTLAQAERVGVPPDELEQWYEEGWIVPLAGER